MDQSGVRPVTPPNPGPGTDDLQKVPRPQEIWGESGEWEPCLGLREGHSHLPWTPPAAEGLASVPGPNPPHAPLRDKGHGDDGRSQKPYTRWFPGLGPHHLPVGAAGSASSSLPSDPVIGAFRPELSATASHASREMSGGRLRRAAERTSNHAAGKILDSAVLESPPRPGRQEGPEGERKGAGGEAPPEGRHRRTLKRNRPAWEVGLTG